MLAESGIGTSEDVQKAKSESEGLGRFVRSLVGLNREAAKAAFATFLAGKNLRGNQIEFVNLIIDHLTEHGSMEAGLLYTSPYTDINPLGPDGVFAPADIEELIRVLESIRKHAVGEGDCR